MQCRYMTASRRVTIVRRRSAMRRREMLGDVRVRMRMRMQGIVIRRRGGGKRKQRRIPIGAESTTRPRQPRRLVEPVRTTFVCSPSHHHHQQHHHYHHYYFLLSLPHISLSISSAPVYRPRHSLLKILSCIHLHAPDISEPPNKQTHLVRRHELEFIATAVGPRPVQCVSQYFYR
jgi:hypothetical protein